MEVMGLMVCSSIYRKKSQRLAIIALPMFNNLKGTFLTTGVEREGYGGKRGIKQVCLMQDLY